MRYGEMCAWRYFIHMQFSLYHINKFTFKGSLHPDINCDNDTGCNVFGV